MNFSTTASLPEEYRQPFPARRRFRELARGPALAISTRQLQQNVRDDGPIAASNLLKILRKQRHTYWDPKNASSPILSVLCVRVQGNARSLAIG